MSKRSDSLKDFLAPIQLNDASPRSTKAPVQSGALKSMNQAFTNLAHDAELAEVLRTQIQAGELIIDVDPADIRPSFIRDRLDDYQGEDFAELRESLRTAGQIIPVLLRPHPNEKNVYQLAFGHRRVEALRQLGLKVKAVVRNLSDDDLIVAQGKENTERRDLSFIEKAFFALQLEEKGVKRRVIMDALASTSKGVLSGMISLASALPSELVHAIGPAPSIGRPRWESMAQKLAQDAEGQNWRSALRIPGFSELDSDVRFEKVFAAIQLARAPENKVLSINSSEGHRIATAQVGKRSTKFIFQGGRSKDFSSYLLDRLPELYSAFLKNVQE